jgi:hypothetical protein
MAIDEPTFTIFNPTALRIAPLGFALLDPALRNPTLYLFACP